MPWQKDTFKQSIQNRNILFSTSVWLFRINRIISLCFTVRVACTYKHAFGYYHAVSCIVLVSFIDRTFFMQFKYCVTFEIRMFFYRKKNRRDFFFMYWIAAELQRKRLHWLGQWQTIAIDSHSAARAKKDVQLWKDPCWWGL